MSRHTKIVLILAAITAIAAGVAIRHINRTQCPTHFPPVGTSIHHDGAADAVAAKDYGKSISVVQNPYAGVYTKQIDLVITEPIAFQLKDGEYTVLGTVAPSKRVSMNCWGDRCDLNIDKDESGALINKDADKALIKTLSERGSIFFALGTNGYAIYAQSPHTVGIRN